MDISIPKRNQGYVYVIRNTNTGMTKIGITKNLTRRLKQLKKKFGNIEIINTFHSKLYNMTEKHLHDYYSDYHVRLELFNLPPSAVIELKTLQFKDSNIHQIIHSSINGNDFRNIQLDYCLIGNKKSL